MQLTQVPGPPRRERTEKPWAQDGEQTGGEDESISTVNTVAPTGVVDLMNSSCEAGEAAGDLGNGEDDVNYELSDEEEVVVQEEVVAQEEVVVLTEAEQKKARKAANDKASKAKRAEEKRAKEQAEREQGGEGEVDTAPALLAVLKGQKPGTQSMIKKKKLVIETSEDEEESGDGDEGSTGKA
jgi:hypothetical protein